MGVGNVEGAAVGLDLAGERDGDTVGFEIDRINTDALSVCFFFSLVAAASWVEGAASTRRQPLQGGMPACAGWTPGTALPERSL